MDTINQILATHGLKKTTSRHDILLLFVNNDFAISQSHIENSLSDLDRVTIYRTLNTFETKGIIHKIKGADNEVKYAHCTGHCHEGEHDDNHLHFTCNACDKTYCLDQSSPSIQLPIGYNITRTSVLVEGVCIHCND